MDLSLEVVLLLPGLQEKKKGGSRVKKTEFAHERIESDFEDAPY